MKLLWLTKRWQTQKPIYSSIDSFIHWFSKHFLKSYYVPGSVTMLGKHHWRNQTNIPAHMKLTFQLGGGRQTRNLVNQQIMWCDRRWYILQGNKSKPEEGEFRVLRWCGGNRRKLGKASWECEIWAKIRNGSEEITKHISGRRRAWAEVLHGITPVRWRESEEEVAGLQRVRRSTVGEETRGVMGVGG